MNKQKLLKVANYAHENNAYLAVMAGDYITDYVKLILPNLVKNFIQEVEFGGEDQPKFHRVRIDNDNKKLKDYFYEGDINQYYIYGAKAIAPEDVKDLVALVEDTCDNFAKIDNLFDE